MEAIAASHALSEPGALISFEQVLVAGVGLLITGLFSVAFYFLRKSLDTIDAIEKELAKQKTDCSVEINGARASLERLISEFKLHVEQSFVSYDTFQEAQSKLREDLKEIFKGIGDIKEQLASLKPRRR